MDMILILYVDDLLILGEGQSKIADIKHQLGKLYQMKNLGPASSSLGIWITRDHNRWVIWVDQEAYIDNTLEQFNLIHANNMNTPLPAGIHLEKSEYMATTETKTYFWQIIRTLIYAAIGTRPNIAFAATWFSQYNNNLTKTHIKYTRYVLRCLQDMKKLKINYDGGSDAGLIGYSDLVWGENKMIIRTCFPDGKWCNLLGIVTSEDSSTFSGRSWIYGISQCWMTRCMV